MKSSLLETPTRHDGSMFVGIPAYRDPQTPSTIASMVENAACPDKLTVAVFLQHDALVDKQAYDELTSVIAEVAKQGTKVKVHEVDYREARNAYYARFMVQKMYDNE